MPRHSLLHKLNIHPKYLSMHRHLSHFHHAHNPKAHGGKLTHRHHHTHHAHHAHHAHHMIEHGEGMHHRRRPTPLHFKL